MNVIILLILASLAVALLFLAGFVWAVRSGQFEDTLTPSLRVLAEEGSGQAGGQAAPEPASVKILGRLNPKQTK
jgi:cbb3-type cytochrome oxidase maturation protein